MRDRKTKQVNPWLHIWVAPKKTLQAILDTNPQGLIIWFALISGILTSLIALPILWEGHPERVDFRSPLFVVAIVITGVLFGIVQLYLVSWLYQLTGAWLGGNGSYTEVKCAVGWSMYPMIISNLFAVGSLFLIKHPVVNAIFGIINMGISIWGIVIFIALLAQAHKFSAWKALGCILLAFLLIFVAMMLISLLVPLLSPLFVT